MPKKSPKQPQPEAETTLAPASVQTPAPAKSKAQPITVKKFDPLPPDAVKRRDEFYKDSYDQELAILRSMGR